MTRPALKTARRIVFTVIITVVVLFVGLYGIAPVALSYSATRHALPITRVVPTELQDKSVSQAAATKLSFFGYEFDVPWSDFDESKTEFYPKNKPRKNAVRLFFRSGLQLIVGAAPPHSMADVVTKTELHMPPQSFVTVFGSEAATSDYAFMKRVFEFSPDRMHHWGLSPTAWSREQVLLTVKTLVPSKGAQSGIFNIGNNDFKGFQQGNPQVRQDSFLVDLYSDDGGIELRIIQPNNPNGVRVSQPDINRIVQSLHRAVPASSQTAKN